MMVENCIVELTKVLELIEIKKPEILLFKICNKNIALSFLNISKFGSNYFSISESNQKHSFFMTTFEHFFLYYKII